MINGKLKVGNLVEHSEQAVCVDQGIVVVIGACKSCLAKSERPVHEDCTVLNPEWK